MSELGEKRKLFTRCFALLILKMVEKGYHPMVGKDGLKHMKGSLHYEGLAADVDLIGPDGKYLSSTDDHKEFGEYWESLADDCCWGGRFNDGNHYSVTYGGKK